MATYYLLDGTSYVRDFTGVTDIQVVSNENIEFYIENNEAEIFKKLNLRFYENTVSEEYDGDGSQTLVLRHYPLISVTSLSIDDCGVPSTCYLVYTDKNVVFLKEGIFTKHTVDKQNVDITYTYGIPYTEDQYKFKTARKLCLYMTAVDVLMQAGNHKSEGMVREKLGEYSLDFGSSGAYGKEIDRLKTLIKDIYDTLGVTKSILAL